MLRTQIFLTIVYTCLLISQWYLAIEHLIEVFDFEDHWIHHLKHIVLSSLVLVVLAILSFFITQYATRILRVSKTTSKHPEKVEVIMTENIPRLFFLMRQISYHFIILFILHFFNHIT